MPTPESEPELDRDGFTPEQNVNDPDERRLAEEALERDEKPLFPTPTAGSRLTADQLADDLRDE